MNKSKIIKGLYQVIVDNEIDKHLDRQATAIATSLYAMLDSMLWLNTQPRAKLFEVNDAIEIEAKARKAEVDAGIEAFIEDMYKLYPTKCPKRNTSLGKSRKDKVKIKRLLKTYSQEEIERVIRHEVDSNYGVNYMKNFSTFLNNFPDPASIDGINSTTQAYAESQILNNTLVIGGVVYK